MTIGNNGNQRGNSYKAKKQTPHKQDANGLA